MKKIFITFVFLIISFIIPTHVDAEEQYYELKDYNINISIPSNYDVIIKNKDNSSIYDKLGLDENEIENYMNSLQAFFLATTQDLKKNIILTRKQDKDTKDFYDLSELDEDVLNGLAEGYSKGFNTNDYSIEKNNSITYIKLKYDLISAKNEHLYYLKYKTIYNGYDYTIYIQKYSAITSNDENELKSILKNIEIKKINNPNNYSLNHVFLWIVNLSFIIMIICAIYKSKKMKSNKKKKDDIVYTCDNCDADVSEDDEKCPNCGAIFSETVDENKKSKKNKYKCLNCGASVSEEDDKCPNCGAIFSETVDEKKETKKNKYKCLNCGASVSEEDKKCPKCGEKFEQEKKDLKKNENKSSDSSVDKKYSDLNKLKKLLDKKIITKEEFEKEKKKILKDD